MTPAVGSPSHESMMMSYVDRSPALSQSDAGDWGDPEAALPPDPWKMWRDRRDRRSDPVKNASSTPMRVSRHSSVSAPPVDTAMLGMLA